MPEMPADVPALHAPMFDLAQVPTRPIDLRVVRPRCPVAAEGDIVVCAPDPEKERLKALPDDIEGPKGLPKAELGIGENATVGLSMEAAGVGGFVSNRVMIGTKLKF